MVYLGKIVLANTNKLQKGMLAVMNTGRYVVVTNVTPETVSVKSVIKGKENYSHFKPRDANEVMTGFRVNVHIPDLDFTIEEKFIYRELVQSVLTKKLREGNEVIITTKDNSKELPRDAQGFYQIRVPKRYKHTGNELIRMVQSIVRELVSSENNLKGKSGEELDELVFPLVTKRIQTRRDEDDSEGTQSDAIEVHTSEEVLEGKEIPNVLEEKGEPGNRIGE